MKILEELKKVFEDVGIDFRKLFIIICGFGIIVCVFVLVLYFCGKLDIRVYDGFWVEWG